MAPSGASEGRFVNTRHTYSRSRLLEANSRSVCVRSEDSLLQLGKPHVGFNVTGDNAFQYAVTEFAL